MGFMATKGYPHVRLYKEDATISSICLLVFTATHHLAVFVEGGDVLPYLVIVGFYQGAAASVALPGTMTIDGIGHM